MNRLHRISILLFISLFSFQCQKELSFIGSSDPGVPAVITPDPIKATLQGNIVDENNEPAAGVTITAGTMTAMTDRFGYFRITDASLDKNTSLVTAQKAGYFKGYRVFAATSGTNQVVIKLLKKNLVGTITASSGGNATLSNGAKISIPANSAVVVSSGSAYSGDINVYAAYINPATSDIAETVPGSFAADDKNGKRVVLSSYGMLAVELESAAGEKLQIKSGTVATLTTPIPSVSLSSAPATIASWYVDEQTGIWKEEGTATKQGNNYVGDVKHFSFWNCDYPYDAVSLSLTLHNDKGLPLVNVFVKLLLSDTSTRATAYGYTDSLGQIKGFVPSGKNLIMEVDDPCYISVYSKSLSPLNQNTNLGIITITNTTSSLSTVKGTLLDCSGLPLKKGYVVINFNNIIRYAPTDAAGKFTSTFITCSGTPATAVIFGVNETTQQQSGTTILTVIAPVTDAGNITACGTSAEQYINYTLNGTDYTITSVANDTITGFNFNMGVENNVDIHGGKAPPGSGSISFTALGVSATGTFPIINLVLQNFRLITMLQPFNVNLTTYANTAGEFYEGTLAGKFTDSASTIHNLSATFKVRRIN
jgi:hypothetical protein